MTTAMQMPFFETAMTPPAWGAFDLHALSIPARTFTGDFYFVERSAPALWLAVGDVSGKGVGAAVFMAMIQEQLDSVAERCRSIGSQPATIAAELDVLLRSVLPPNKFASAVIASLDVSGTLRVANAGHTPLLIARRNGTVEAIGSTGPVLGILDGARWRSARASLEPGDAVLAYSDGVIEARRDDGEEYGVDRLSAAFGAIARHETDAAGIAAAVERDVRRFAGSYDDDLTVVAVRHNALTPGH